MSELDQLAARGDRTRSKRRQQKAHKAREKREREDGARQALIDMSLAGGGVSRALPIGLVFVTLLWACMAILVHGQQPFLPGGPLFFVVLVGPLVVTVLFLALGLDWLAKLKANRERAWLAARPFEIQIEAYERGLGSRRNKTTVNIEVIFEAEVPSERQSVLADAVLGAMGDGDARFKDGKLVIRSPRLDTSRKHQSQRSASRTVHDNGPAHSWFHQCIEHALERIHSEHAIARVIPRAS